MTGCLKRSRNGTIYSVCLTLGLAAAALPQLVSGETIPPHLWSKRFGDVSADTPAGIAVNSNGNVILAANFRGTVNFGGSDLTSLGGIDIVLAKFGSDGSHQWSKRVGGTSDDTVSTLALYSTNIAITGRFLGTADFGGGGLASAGDLDIFVAMYTDTGTDGAFSWAKRFGDTGLDLAFGAAMDSSGVVITGTFQGTVNFGGGDLICPFSTDIFIAKYTLNNGTYIWADQFGGPSTDQGLSVTVDGAGAVVATGWFFGTINFGGADLDSAGTGDIYLVKLSGTTGSHIWSTSYGGTDLDNGIVVAVDGSSVLLGGNFKDTVNFGGGLTSAGDFDIVLLKLGTLPQSSARRAQLVGE